MTWQPIDLNETTHRLNLEILRAAANEDIHTRREGGQVVYFYDDETSDYYFDGSDVTEEVSHLIWDGFLSDRSGHVRITDIGRAHLLEVPR